MRRWSHQHQAAVRWRPGHVQCHPDANLAHDVFNTDLTAAVLRKHYRHNRWQMEHTCMKAIREHDKKEKIDINTHQVLATSIILSASSRPSYFPLISSHACNITVVRQFTTLTILHSFTSAFKPACLMNPSRLTLPSSLSPCLQRHKTQTGSSVLNDYISRES